MRSTAPAEPKARHQLCDGCGAGPLGMAETYPVQHIDGDSLALCLECATILYDEKKVADA